MKSHGLFDDITDTREALHAVRLRLLDFPLTPGEEVERLIAAKPLAQELAADPAVKPAPAHGEVGNGRRGDNVTSTQKGNSASYLVRRLKRDAPDVDYAL